MNLTEIRAAHSIASAIPEVVLKLTAVHIAAIFFLSGLILATILLGLQYAFRYRKYHVTHLEDQDSLAGKTRNNCISITNFVLTNIYFSASNASIPLPKRAQSSSTLLSEVISLTRIRPLAMSSRQHKHSRLRESMDCDQNEAESEITLR